MWFEQPLVYLVKRSHLIYWTLHPRCCRSDTDVCTWDNSLYGRRVRTHTSSFPMVRFCPLTAKGDVSYLHPSDESKMPGVSVSSRFFACLGEEVSLTICGKFEKRLPGNSGTTPMKKPLALVDEDPAPDGEAEPVDEQEEPGRQAQREEATSLDHRLRHLPKNPYCDSRNRAKFRLSKKFAGSFSKRLQLFGENMLQATTWSLWENSANGYMVARMCFSPLACSRD